MAEIDTAKIIVICIEKENYDGAKKSMEERQ